MLGQSEVYIVKDDEPARRALVSLLETAGIVSRTFDNGFDFLEACGELPTGCIITGLETPGIGAFELIRRLNAEHVSYPAIIVANYGNVAQAVEAMKAGAADFIEKPYGGEVLLRAVRSALKMNEGVSARVASQRLQRQILAALTPREHDVLNGIAEGKSNKSIARHFGISPRTVEAHRAKMMSKSGAHSVSELVRLAATTVNMNTALVSPHCAGCYSVGTAVAAWQGRSRSSNSLAINPLKLDKSPRLGIKPAAARQIATSA